MGSINLIDSLKLTYFNLSLLLSMFTTKELNSKNETMPEPLIFFILESAPPLVYMDLLFSQIIVRVNKSHENFNINVNISAN